MSRFRYMVLFPNGKNARCSSHLSLYLFRKDSSELPFDVEVQIWLVSKGERIQQSKLQNRSINEFLGKVDGFSAFISHKKFKKRANEIIIDGNLQIALEVRRK